MSGRPSPRRRAAVAASAAALGLGACSRRSPSTLDPHGSAAARINGVWWLMFALAVGVFVVVGGLLLVGSLRRPRGSSDGPSDTSWILAGGVVVPTLILLVLAVDTVRTTRALRASAHSGVEHVEVVGHEWWWEVRYPRENVVTANEVHLPVGRPVEIGLTTADVIHSFWVPQLAGKLDTIPGQHNTLRFTANRTGTYRGECLQYCGVQHANMNLVVVVQPAADFATWAAANAQPAPTPSDPLAAEGEQVFTNQPCAGCHAVRGTSAVGTKGPDLTHFGSRLTIGANTEPNTPENLGTWISNSQDIKPGNLMPPIPLSGEELRAVIAYLEGQR
jgi:cytochrome c oxidase subunit 2